MRQYINGTKDFRLLSFVIYAIFDNYVCIDDIACQSNKSSVICRDKKSGYELKKLRGIGIPDLLVNLLLCHSFMKNIHFTVI